ncbi:hypothetical protein EVAR_69151_1 [Eumeta japonica]|uniref:Uncharacterized protein n=1 Tax=Eumeta variegata TaxID=151549 RepID=A0A4C1SQQ4_EUMVA|nr:hypothetical protein EVAR_69151_1 [Eumeta japonica]
MTISRFPHIFIAVAAPRFSFDAPPTPPCHPVAEARNETWSWFFPDNENTLLQNALQMVNTVDDAAARILPTVLESHRPRSFEINLLLKSERLLCWRAGGAGGRGRATKQMSVLARYLTGAFISPRAHAAPQKMWSRLCSVLKHRQRGRPLPRPAPAPPRPIKCLRRVILTRPARYRYSALIF